MDIEVGDRPPDPRPEADRDTSVAELLTILPWQRVAKQRGVLRNTESRRHVSCAPFGLATRCCHRLCC
jgi:hypothetical protein